jgi:hypothetical protein
MMTGNVTRELLKCHNRRAIAGTQIAEAHVTNMINWSFCYIMSLRVYHNVIGGELP